MADIKGKFLKSGGIFAGVVFCLILGVLIFVFEAKTAFAEDDKAIAKANGVKLKKADFDDAMNEIVPAAIFHGGISLEKLEKYRPQAIEKMIEKELLFQLAKAKGMALPEKWLKEQKEKTIEKMGGRRAFEKALKKAKQTEKEFWRRGEKKYLVKLLLKKEVEDKAVVPDEEARDYYERNVKSFLRPASRHVKHILISVSPTASVEEKNEKRELAREVLEKAKRGEDFAKLAWDYSDDPYKVKGGDLGLVHEGRLDPALEEVVFSLGEGELTHVVETIYGYHIAKVERVNRQEQISFEAVRVKIKRELEDDRKETLKDELVKKAKEGAKIEVFD